MIQYILECIAFQLVFLVIYDLWLKRETFFQWNRFYLIGTYVLSLVLPWIKIEAFKTTVPEQFYAYPEFLWGVQNTSMAVKSGETSWMQITWEQGLFVGGMCAASILFGYKLYRIYGLRQKGQVRYFPDFTRITIANSWLAFSFFKSIFLGDKISGTERESIIKHELVHIKQKHSLDLMFFELMRIVCWFNPLVYVYQSRISELHEFIADAEVAKTRKREHYHLLLSQVFQTENISFINQFFKGSLIKNRIIMLQKAKSKSTGQLKYLLLVPLVLGMLVYASCERDVNDVNGHLSLADADLIRNIEKELDLYEENRNLIFTILMDKGIVGKLNSDEILSKEEYFLHELATKKIFRMIRESYLKENSDVKEYKAIGEHPNPSTARYESYVNRKKAFQLLDPNLRISIDAYKQDIAMINKQDGYPSHYYVHQVADSRKLTTQEIIDFNNKMEEVFEEGGRHTHIIVTDGEYAFHVYHKTPLNLNSDSSKISASEKGARNKTKYEKLLENRTPTNAQTITTTEKYNRLVEERKRLLKNTTEQSPIVQNLDMQIRGLLNQIP